MSRLLLLFALLAQVPVNAQNGTVFAGPVKISFWGFICNNPTNDNSGSLDGSGDEVMVSFRSWGQPFNNLMNARYEQADLVYGENFLPNDKRVKAGSLTINGGLKAGDSYFREAVNYDNDPNTVSRYAIAAGWCDENTVMAILPVIWEKDNEVFPAQDPVDFENRITAAFGDPAFQQKLLSMKPACDAYDGRNPYAYVVPGSASGLDNYFIGAFSNYNTIRMSLPIGILPDGKFPSSLLVFTPKMLLLLSQRDFGYGMGVVPVTYRNRDSQAASYTILLKIVSGIKAKEQPVRPMPAPKRVPVAINTQPVVMTQMATVMNNEFLYGVWKGTWGVGDNNKDQFYSFKFNNNVFWVLNAQESATASGGYKIENGNFTATYIDNSNGWKYEIRSTGYNTQTRELIGTWTCTGTGYYRTGKWVVQKTSN